ncbi:MAG TPA: M14 family metallopeptidase [Nevskia sp.]|nr:M14 family metallopeptidase [Nevskia sp.]
MTSARFARYLPGLLLACCSTLAGAAAPAPAASASLTTLAEQTGYRQTGRYTEVERLCQAYQQTWPEAVRCFEFGRSPEGRPLLALSVSRSGALTAEVARQRGIPVFLMQAGIHAGEIDGKDAGFLALREMLQGTLAPKALEHEVIVFVPVFNVDGHERFGHWNRPNQVGPEEMGWRTTAQNLNLNRDYMKAEAPEMQAMLHLLDQWDPIVYADLHVTDGANFQHDVSITVEPLYAGDSGLRDAAAEMQQETNRRLAAAGALPLDFYPSFERSDDPASGFAVQVATPRFSTGYWGLRNRLAMLVETHSWKDYPTRVRITHNTIVALAEQVATRGQAWMHTAQRADARAAKLGGEQVPLNFEAGEHVKMIDFKGYAYVREPSAVSGGLLTRYDTSKPEVWHIPLKDTVKASLQVRAPKAGYIVPAAWADEIGQKLALHGIEFRRLDTPPGRLEVETFRATSAEFKKPPFEGRTSPTLAGEWKTETREVPVGSLYVPLAQPKARLILGLLEPLASDSFAAWGIFNGSFEQKEYMEPYVAEQVAQQMLAKDAALAQEFRHKLDTDDAFAHDPQARLDFFYRRAPSWDERLNLYPLYRVQQVPAGS